jgi:hypothetical protein
MRRTAALRDRAIEAKSYHELCLLDPSISPASLSAFSRFRRTIRYFPDGCKAGCDEARYSDGAAAIVENRK